jgi:hypothetical protein
MKVQINGKVFTADTQESHRIKIEKDLDDFDILFFKKWFRDSLKSETGYKKDYVKDIDYISKLGSGTFINCFPCELGEDYVILVYNTIDVIS